MCAALLQLSSQRGPSNDVGSRLAPMQRPPQRPTHAHPNFNPALDSPIPHSAGQRLAPAATNRALLDDVNLATCRSTSSFDTAPVPDGMKLECACLSLPANSANATLLHTAPVPDPGPLVFSAVRRASWRAPPPNPIASCNMLLVAVTDLLCSYSPRKRHRLSVGDS
ncbi:uncharacterized protein K452DRAFT_363254 [Aplosporella prunicola CBS 121167]|uniref:Uncharacterized protein n=1 Tax=Aplosporella prunicola CBS 121167 TaxID=1176127 RepID=A0A6A6AWG3_9PEZI|nr:uncharacterized protein K452DRAFT_363254 [Aplosporella prunicola CBS 121167]KAF2135284.1 hypothetical protein K452DRAFT_363254 [Aplosporella prunicola CBS 121167]